MTERDYILGSRRIMNELVGIPGLCLSVSAERRGGDVIARVDLSAGGGESRTIRVHAPVDDAIVKMLSAVAEDLSSLGDYPAWMRESLATILSVAGTREFDRARTLALVLIADLECDDIPVPVVAAKYGEVWLYWSHGQKSLGVRLGRDGNFYSVHPSSGGDEGPVTLVPADQAANPPVARPDRLRRAIRDVFSCSSRPFGIGLAEGLRETGWFSPEEIAAICRARMESENG